ncbi:MAG: hypothetical protein NE334_09005 [Lentisphaeraceae bacterium]|nr:hypothetical protein [Lentisphaeraceae bacterium]
MKAIILKSILPPLFFFILYINLNFFVFSFDARNSYLNKRLNKTNKDIAELESETKPLVNDKQNKTHEELTNSLKALEVIIDNGENLLLETVNIYKTFGANNLTLLSEQSVKSGANVQEQFAQVTNFTVTGDYQDVIKTLKDIANSELIPVHFTLIASSKHETKYTISIWNRNEQF